MLNPVYKLGVFINNITAVALTRLCDVQNEIIDEFSVNKYAQKTQNQDYYMYAEGHSC